MCVCVCVCVRACVCVCARACERVRVRLAHTGTRGYWMVNTIARLAMLCCNGHTNTNTNTNKNRKVSKLAKLAILARILFFFSP